MFRLEGFEQLSQVNRCVPGRISAEIARMFKVQKTDVGLLWIQADGLVFLFPSELQVAGRIPLSSSAIAAQTARSKRAEYFNDFPRVPHHTAFERITLSSVRPLSEMPDPIQKLMSVPIVSDSDKVLGVIQVCRKGMTSSIAGPDFTDEDLEMLVRTAKILAELAPELEFPESPAPQQMLRFRHEARKRSA